MFYQSINYLFLSNTVVPTPSISIIGLQSHLFMEPTDFIVKLPPYSPNLLIVPITGYGGTDK